MHRLRSCAVAAGFVLAAALAGVTSAPERAEARSGFSLYIGPGHGWGYGYGPYSWRPYGYSPHYYAPPPPRRYYPGAGRCGKWARRCARNWGWRNSDWRGCMLYHGC